MNRMKSAFLWHLFAFSVVLLVSSVPAMYMAAWAAHSPDSSFSVSQDTVRPEIREWGIEGRAATGESFRVWADVVDYESGLRNVTFILNSNNATVSRVNIYPMENNGTLHVVQHPGLAVNFTYLFRVLAFDMANNSALSYSRTISRYPNTETAIDPNVTMPVVVTSSLAFFALVSLLAYVYDRRQRRLSRSGMPEQIAQWL